MPRLTTPGNRRIIDLPLPESKPISVSQLRRLANLDNNLEIVRDNEAPITLRDDDLVYPDEELQLLPKHIAG